ncbi:MAG: hypothetical protein V1735_06360 [Nanoarchaeota archaeon]
MTRTPVLKNPDFTKAIIAVIEGNTTLDEITFAVYPGKTLKKENAYSFIRNLDADNPRSSVPFLNCRGKKGRSPGKWALSHVGILRGLLAFMKSELKPADFPCEGRAVASRFVRFFRERVKDGKLPPLDKVIYAFLFTCHVHNLRWTGSAVNSPLQKESADYLLGDFNPFEQREMTKFLCSVHAYMLGRLQTMPPR